MHETLWKVENTEQIVKFMMIYIYKLLLAVKNTKKKENTSLHNLVTNNIVSQDVFTVKNFQCTPK